VQRGLIGLNFDSQPSKLRGTKAQALAQAQVSICPAWPPRCWTQSDAHAQSDVCNPIHNARTLARAARATGVTGNPRGAQFRAPATAARTRQKQADKIKPHRTLASAAHRRADCWHRRTSCLREVGVATNRAGLTRLVTCAHPARPQWPPARCLLRMAPAVSCLGGACQSTDRVSCLVWRSAPPAAYSTLPPWLPPTDPGGCRLRGRLLCLPGASHVPGPTA